LLKRVKVLLCFIAINRKVGLKKAPSCLNFIASIIKNLPDNENGEKGSVKQGNVDSAIYRSLETLAPPNSHRDLVPGSAVGLRNLAKEL